MESPGNKPARVQLYLGQRRFPSSSRICWTMYLCRGEGTPRLFWQSMLKRKLGSDCLLDIDNIFRVGTDEHLGHQRGRRGESRKGGQSHRSIFLRTTSWQGPGMERGTETCLICCGGEDASARSQPSSSIAGEPVDSLIANPTLKWTTDGCPTTVPQTSLQS